MVTGLPPQPGMVTPPDAGAPSEAWWCVAPRELMPGWCDRAVCGTPEACEHEGWQPGDCLVILRWGGGGSWGANLKINNSGLELFSCREQKNRTCKSSFDRPHGACREEMKNVMEMNK